MFALLFLFTVALAVSKVFSRHFSQLAGAWRRLQEYFVQALGPVLGRGQTSLQRGLGGFLLLQMKCYSALSSQLLGLASGLVSPLSAAAVSCAPSLRGSAVV